MKPIHVEVSLNDPDLRGKLQAAATDMIVGLATSFINKDYGIIYNYPDPPETRAARKKEVKTNGERFFDVILPTLIDDYAGRYVILRQGQVKMIVSSFRTAVDCGYFMFGDGIFSVQEISKESELSYYSENDIIYGRGTLDGHFNTQPRGLQNDYSY